MDKSIGIIGSGEAGKAAIQALKEKGIDVVVIDNIEPDESFDLNGVKYAPIKTEKRKHKKTKLGAFIAAASIMCMPSMDELYGYGDSPYERKLPAGTDIVKEYGLIQLKKSKLSRWERDAVVRIFERNYYRID